MELIEIVLFIIIICLPLIAQIKIRFTYKKYSKINCNKNLKGKDVARMILDRNGLNNISIEEISGTLTDHYNPKSKSISLSTSIYNESSISAIAVAAHECGHAIQDKEAYSYFNLRSKLVPVVNVTSKLSSIFVIIGFVSEYVNLIDIGILLLSCGLFFQLVTLPVEFNASNRAKNQLKELGLVTNSEIKGVRKVLFAAALTYVAGFISEALQILRLVLLSRRRR